MSECDGANSDQRGRWALAGRFRCGSADRSRPVSRWRNRGQGEVRDRYSAVLFFDPNFDVEVACLECCQGPDDPPRYPMTTSGEYLLGRFDATFSYRKG